MNKDVSDEVFISMMQLWVYKNATYPLELITFLLSDNGEKNIAIPDYGSDGSNYLYLGKESYTNYTSALTKLGALMDKMDYERSLKVYKSGHPLSCPNFCGGYDSPHDSNPFEESTDNYIEWESGRFFRLSEDELK